MRLLGLDFETTGLDSQKDRITEVGAVIWCTERRTPLWMMSELVHDKLSYPALSQEIQDITGIDQIMLDHFGVEPKLAIRKLVEASKQCEFFVAHNGLNFDRLFLLEECKRLTEDFPEKLPWIDTRLDVPYPAHIETRRLSHLASEHGFLNPFAHRAVFDVLTMMKVLDHYDLTEVIKYSKAPLVTVRAMVGYDDREKAKARRYNWDGNNKVWTKLIKDFQVEKEIKEAPFQVVIFT